MACGKVHQTISSVIYMKINQIGETRLSTLGCGLHAMVHMDILLS